MTGQNVPPTCGPLPPESEGGMHPLVFDPAWRTQTVIGLATAIAAERAYDRMPILADALEEADCDAPHILTHCRAGEPHRPDCWVLALVGVTTPPPAPAPAPAARTLGQAVRDFWLDDGPPPPGWRDSVAVWGHLVLFMVMLAASVVAWARGYFKHPAFFIVALVVLLPILGYMIWSDARGPSVRPQRRRP